MPRPALPHLSRPLGVCVWGARCPAQPCLASHAPLVCVGGEPGAPPSPASPLTPPWCGWVGSQVSRPALPRLSRPLGVGGWEARCPAQPCLASHTPLVWVGSQVPRPALPHLSRPLGALGRSQVRRCGNACAHSSCLKWRPPFAATSRSWRRSWMSSRGE